MDYNDYQARSKTTAVYPNVGNNFGYVALGLCDELAELMEKAWDPNEKPGAVELELGDVVWYLAQAASELGVELGDFFPPESSVPPAGSETPGNERDQADSTEERRKNYLDDPVIVRVLKITGLAGKIAGLAKKIIRDGEGVISDSRRAQLTAALSAFASELKSWASDQKTDLCLKRAMRKNLEKLESRQKRGKLKGSGDYR